MYPMFPSADYLSITRAAVAFCGAEVDARLTLATPVDGVFHPPKELPTPRDYVLQLIEKNRDVYDKLINHPFPRSLGDGTASLDAFRFYMIQDKLYLEDYIRVKMIAVAQTAEPSFRQVAAFVLKLPWLLQYVKNQNDVCAEQLGVAQSVIDATPLSSALKEIREFNAQVASGDHWFAIHIALLPCVMGYWEIADKLANAPSTVRNVMYHPLWTIHNIDKSFVDAYRYFINQHIPENPSPEAEARWNAIFRRACEMETQFFGVAGELTEPYRIIPDDTYSIQSFRSGCHLAVLDLGNLTRHLPEEFCDTRVFVVGVPQTGTDHEKWDVVASTNGYTFQNVGTGLYLGIDVVPTRGRRLQAVPVPYYWWINPVPSMPGQGRYQVYDSKNLRHILQIDEENLETFQIPDFGNLSIKLPALTDIIVRDNCEASAQIWNIA